ncbi:serine carboxypeptidase-like 42 [Dorcoceras hygrometricum]|uniref:Serine carboxypeptidase-like 42 n=1 Tax=Dorcoceras hygrometricum TaxID=472368 RepID=A0A2Z7BET5_9LAMI|nr:serine carboxypeptidase-like 42 [Dorcoceras hygrometricum]
MQRLPAATSTIKMTTYVSHATVTIYIKFHQLYELNQLCPTLLAQQTALNEAQEYRLLHDIVAKSLSTKSRSFDVVNTKIFEMMVAISIGLKVDMVRDDQTYMKHDSDIFRRAFYRKMDEVVTSVNSSQTVLETNLVHRFTESQQHIASDFDFVKLRLALGKWAVVRVEVKGDPNWCLCAANRRVGVMQSVLCGLCGRGLGFGSGWSDDGPIDAVLAKGGRNSGAEILGVCMVKWQHRGVGDPEKGRVNRITTWYQSGGSGGGTSLLRGARKSHCQSLTELTGLRGVGRRETTFSGRGSSSSPSGDSLRSSRRRDLIRGLLRAQILRGHNSIGHRASRGRSSRGPIPLDQGGHRFARSAISRIQDRAW